MSDYQLGAVESRFAEIIWENQPITSTELVKRSEALLNWKKSTTYTVLKRLCDKGIFENNGGVVTALISREELASLQSQRFVQETFKGSLPAFLAAFSAGKGLTAEEVRELRKMVDSYEEG